MGYIRHHAIVVTGTYDRFIYKAHAKAETIFGYMSPIIDGAINETKSFFIPPDGSKESWEESVKGDKNRDEFIAYLETLKYDDGSSPLSWVEVQYGDDNLQTKIIRDSDMLRPGRIGAELSRLNAEIARLKAAATPEVM